MCCEINKFSPTLSKIKFPQMLLTKYQRLWRMKIQLSIDWSKSFKPRWFSSRMLLNDTEIFQKLSVVLEAECRALIQSTCLFYSDVQKLLHKSLSIWHFFSKPCETAFVAIKLKFTFFFVKTNGHNRVYFFSLATFVCFSFWCRRNLGPWLCARLIHLLKFNHNNHIQSHKAARCVTLCQKKKKKQWPH